MDTGPRRRSGQLRRLQCLATSGWDVEHSGELTWATNCWTERLNPTRWATRHRRGPRSGGGRPVFGTVCSFHKR